MSAPIRNPSIEGAVEVAALTRETKEATEKMGVESRMEQLGDQNEAEQMKRQELNKIRKPQVNQAVGKKEGESDEASDFFKQQLKSNAQLFQKKFGDLDADKLVAMRNQIVGDGKTPRTKEEVLNQVKIYFPIPADTDAALQFLLESGKLPKSFISEVNAAKVEHKNANPVEVLMGGSIGKSAAELKALGLGTPKDMKALFNHLSNNPPANAIEMGKYLGQLYPEPGKFKEAAKYLWREMGAVLRTEREHLSLPHFSNLNKMSKQVAANVVVLSEFKKMGPFLEKRYAKAGLADMD